MENLRRKTFWNSGLIHGGSSQEEFTDKICRNSWNNTGFFSIESLGEFTGVLKRNSLTKYELLDEYMEEFGKNTPEKFLDEFHKSSWRHQLNYCYISGSNSG